MQNMKENNTQRRPRRIAIYVIFDKDGKLDRFRKYYLQELRKEVDTIVGVVSGTLTPESRDELTELTDDFFVRENKGLLAGSWVDGIAHIGWDTLEEYDELLMLNDSFFGPFYPLSEMFDAMEKSDADFFGSMQNFEEKTYTSIAGRPMKHGHFMGSICYFYVIRPRLLHSSEFKDYWSKVPVINEHWDTCFFAEIDFYQYVLDAGFRIDAYQGDKLKGYFFDNLSHNMRKLVIDERIPFARHRPFCTDMKDQSVQINYGQDPRLTLEYIDRYTEYDAGMIWDYILRTKNLTDIFNQLQLEYVVPRNSVERPFAYKKRIAVILHIYYVDQIGRIAGYCKNFPLNTDFYLTTTSEETETCIRETFDQLGVQYELQIRPDEGLVMPTLWVTYAEVITSGKYEYICYFHDRKFPYFQFAVQGEQFATLLYENLIGTPQVIQNIINLLEDNSRMGIVGAPVAYHSDYFMMADRGWGGNYENVVKLAELLELHVDIQLEKMPVSPYGDMFWFRSDALKKAIAHGFTYDDFDIPNKKNFTILHAIERSYGLMAQDSGYYYAEVVNSDWARGDLVNYRYMLQLLSKDLYNKGYYHTNFITLHQIIEGYLPHNGHPRVFAKRFLNGLINRPSTHKFGMWLLTTYRRFFKRK